MITVGIMSTIGIPLALFSVWITRQQVEEQKKRDSSEKAKEGIFDKYGISSNDEKNTCSTTTMNHKSNDVECDVLLLGSGWISKFIIPLVETKDYTISCTTRTKVPDDPFDRIEFNFDKEDENLEDKFKKLPVAKTIVIIFPIKGKHNVEILIDMYEKVKNINDVRWIQLGSTGIWNTNDTGGSPWIDKFSPPDTTNLRCQSENELLELFNKKGTQTCVLNLGGLYGQDRKPSNFLKKLEDKIQDKGSVHFVHGVDVARAIIMLHERFTPGQRWIITNQRVHDWWSIALDLTLPTDLSRLKVLKLMKILKLKAVPRSITEEISDDPHVSICYLNRALDSSHFWNEFDEGPLSGALT